MEAAPEINETTPNLPSRVEESLSACSRFRIVLIGNCGVGKSSLVRSIFKIDLKDIDIAHNRAGRANIEREYTSKENTRFILHDSRGFEAGSADSWNTVERFLRHRSALTRAERVHAIWLCILTPREGTRLQQTGDENLLSLAKELNIPVIAVFTKFDELVNEQFLKALKAGANLSEAEAEQNAQHYFSERVRDFRRRMQVSVVRVSTSEDYTGRFESLLELTKVTRNCLGDNEEAGSVPFIIAQRVSTSQKVGLSVREGFKKYWLNLGNSTVFQGSTLNQCVWRIHDDILKVWNFNDPNKLLSGGKFYAKMILLVSPMLEGSESGFPQDDMFTKCLDVAALALTVASPFAIFLAAAGISLLAVKFFYGTYKKIPSSARYLGAYITALTCILHLLFQETAASEQTNILTEDLVLRTVAQYQRTQSIRHQNLLRGMNVLQGFEKKLAKLILEETNTPETDGLTSPTDLASPTRNDRPSRLVIPSGNVGDRQGEQQSPQQKRSPVWMKNLFAKNS